MNSGGRVNGIETKLSELPRREVVVNPTGSVVTITWAETKFRDAPLSTSATARRAPWGRSGLKECMSWVIGCYQWVERWQESLGGLKVSFPRRFRYRALQPGISTAWIASLAERKSTNLDHARCFKRGARVSSPERGVRETENRSRLSRGIAVLRTRLRQARRYQRTKSKAPALPWTWP